MIPAYALKFTRRAAISVLAITIFTVGIASSAKTAPDGRQQGVSTGSAIIVVSRSTSEIRVIKNGKILDRVKLETPNRLTGLAVGVYHILKERTEGKNRRLKFFPSFHVSKFKWSGLPLFADRAVAEIGSLGGITIPETFARRLGRLIAPGATLIVADSASPPIFVSDIGIQRDVQSQAAPEKDMDPWKSEKFIEPIVDVEEPTAVVISETDRKLFVFCGDALIEEHRLHVRYQHISTGRFVYVQSGRQKDTQDLRWMTISLTGGGYEVPPPIIRADDVLDRFTLDKNIKARVRAHLHIGATLVVVDASVSEFMRNLDVIPLLRSE
ncbi:MAG: hypothetical protein ACRBCJ_03460 [Hyphomicrobiaceae bacterium]